MDEQKRVFLDGAGDDYFRRNIQYIERSHAAAVANPDSDPILRMLVPLRPARILEIGAANGWRLDVAHQLWAARGTGIEPSHAAVEHGKTRFPEIALTVGTADSLPAAQFDCVIFGFCLCWCDRKDLFRIATETDRVLADEGCIVIHDFFPPSPYRNPYTHREGMFSHKMDYAALWRWHPHYALWKHEVSADEDDIGADARNPDQRLAVTILKKFAQ